MYLCYNWAACVSLYQILVLINGVRYQNLYGDDPLRADSQGSFKLREPRPVQQQIQHFDRKQIWQMLEAQRTLLRPPVSYSRHFYNSDEYPIYRRRDFMTEIQGNERLVIPLTQVIHDQYRHSPQRRKY